ncbi:MAG TPA: TetR family transcriptional regulator [Acidimicrobiales bacterium]|nr:TetR family transcriptional regulator [Acidimicrobiales bacterium]
MDIDGRHSSVLTRNQAARRERVIRAAMQLASEGGYDVVQMRDVSTRAEVALGTIYRYFPSKDALLLAVMIEWLGGLEQRVMRDPPPASAGTVDRIMDVLGRALRSMDREPKLTAAVIAAMTAGDPAGVAAIGEVTGTMARIMRSALPEDIDPAVEASAAKVLGHVWWSATIAWANGMGDIDWVAAELREAAELIAARFR